MGLSDKKRDNKEIIYKQATKADASGITRLSILLNKDDKSQKEIEARINRALKNKLVWVAKDNDVIVGYQLCEFFGEDHHNFPNSVFLSELYVYTKYRKNGIGRKLINLALSAKYPSKYEYFSMTHDPKEKFLTKFYESCGFKADGYTKAGNMKLIKKI